VAVYPLPYLEPALAGPVLGCAPGVGHEAVLGAALSAVRGDLSTRPRGTRSVVAAHAFVVGGEPSDSERDISVGGVGAVPAGLFTGVDYVALGHLHGRQQLAPAVRYSGSPLAYSFSEHAQAKGSWLVELGPAGVERVDPVDAPVPRRLAVVRGTLDTLLADPALSQHESAWCQVTLTDDERPAEAMTRLRTRFPHTLELRFEPSSAAAGSTYTRRVTGQDDVALCCGFVEHVRRRPASAAERELLASAVEGARVALARESGVAPLRAGRRLVPAAPVPHAPSSDEERVAG
jgi:exonuclease SbcD